MTSVNNASPPPPRTDSNVHGAPTQVASRAPESVSLDDVLPSGPHRLIPPELIGAPRTPSVTQRLYVVRPGDTMSGIARKMGVSLEALAAANPEIDDLDQIAVGQRLKVPDGAEAPAAGAVPDRGAATGNPYHDEFVRAARKVGVPRSWASNRDLIQLVRRESGFRVGVKNPGSTAFGLFQFLRSTWRRHLPEVAYGTRDPYWQAVGGFRYIRRSYRTPERAFAFWRATVSKTARLAPPDLRGRAREWISKGWSGY